MTYKLDSFKLNVFASFNYNEFPEPKRYNFLLFASYSSQRYIYIINLDFLRFSWLLNYVMTLENLKST